MARYNKSGLSIEEAQEIFDKCLSRGGKSIRIKVGNFFGDWVIGNVGNLNAFYLFEEANGLVNVSYSTNPKTGITEKLLSLAQFYGFIDGDPRENTTASRTQGNGVSLESACDILKSTVMELLPSVGGTCNFCTSSCPTFKRFGVSYNLVSVYSNGSDIRMKIADENGNTKDIKLM